MFTSVVLFSLGVWFFSGRHGSRQATEPLTDNLPTLIARTRRK